MTRRHLIAVPTAAAVMATGFVATADGGVSGSALSRKATIPAATDNKLAFQKKRVRVKRGRITLTMPNPGSNLIDHAIAVARKGPDKRGRTAAPGERSRVRLRLKRGKYTFYCPVPGHRSYGMKGRLIVR